MKSIKERAREYAESEEIGLDTAAFIYCKRDYIKGAIDQKAIDIENACKACENELRKVKTLLNESGVPSNLISVGKSLSNIRKEMEEYK